MKNILLVIVPILFILNSCTTIYKIPHAGCSIYLLEKNDKIDVFDYQGRNSKNSYSRTYYVDLPAHHEIGIKIKKNENGFIYFKSKEVIDTFYLDTVFHIKEDILPVISPPFSTIECNGIKINTTNSAFHYKMKYLKDSIMYFNNQDPMEVNVFEYFAFRNDNPSTEYLNPITIFISKKTGMIMWLNFFVKEQMWYINPNDTTEYNLMSGYGVADYSKVFYISKKRLKKFLM